MADDSPEDAQGDGPGGDDPAAGGSPADRAADDAATPDRAAGAHPGAGAELPDGPPVEGEDLTGVARDLFDLPFHRANGIEVVAAGPDGARMRWPYDESLVGNPEVGAVHGGVVSAMADLTGAIPHVAAEGAYTPTIDLRVDYLSHAGAADLVADAVVRRRGDSVGVSDVTVYSGGTRCAVGKGVYKVSR